MEESYQYLQDFDSNFQHSPDYRSINVRGETYTLTALMAQAVQILHEFYLKGTPDVGQDYMLEELNSHSKRLRDIFQNFEDFHKIIVQGKRKGTFRLNI
ncbi:hypothetical protein ACFL6H_02230 [Candidatus Latescibacterota bacterium]